MNYEFHFNQLFSNFIIVSLILFVAYLFHTSFTLSIYMYKAKLLSANLNDASLNDKIRYKENY